MKLLHNVRFHVLAFAVLLSLLVFRITTNGVGYNLAVPSLARTYALLAVAFLYVTLLIGPLTFTFRSFPRRATLVKSARALGVSAFYFALLHGLLTFFVSMGGWKSIALLRGKSLLAVLLGLSTLLILTVLATTSFDFAVKKMGFKRWKFLHRFVYLVGIFLLVHAFLMNSRLYRSSWIAWTFWIAMIPLLLLQALRVAAYLRKKLRMQLPSSVSSPPVVYPSRALAPDVPPIHSVSTRPSSAPVSSQPSPPSPPPPSLG